MDARWMMGSLVAVVLAGCGGGSSSSMAPEGSQALTDQDNPGIVIPLRASREFFEHNLGGQIQARFFSSNLEPQTYNSQVTWAVLPPKGPAPTEPYIADFRDRLGCADYQDIRGVKLCFTIVPDVSSVDLTAQKLEVVGLKQWLDREFKQSQVVPSSCNSPFQSPRFVEAKKTSEAILVYYIADRVSGSGCEQGKVLVEMALQAL